MSNNIVMDNHALVVEILDEIKWKQIKLIISENNLKKLVTPGSTRIMVKNRRYITRLISSECLKSTNLMYDIFSRWFNNKSDYFSCLTPYFKSESHVKLLEERKLERNLYVLDDGYFDKFILIIDKRDIDKFLKLSPIRFTIIQEKKLIEMLEDSDIKDSTNQDGTTSGINDISEKEQDSFLTKGEKKYYEKKLAEKEKVIEKMGKENIKLLAKQKQHNKTKTEINTEKAKLEKMCADEIKEIERIIEVKSSELVFTKKRQGDLEKTIELKDRQILNIKKKLIKAQAEKVDYFHEILSNIDSEELISNINASDGVTSLLSSVVRKPETDVIGSYNKFNLKEYWISLMHKEKKLLDQILLITADDVVKNQHKDGIIDDEIYDLKISLSARRYLIDILGEIFNQYDC